MATCGSKWVKSREEIVECLKKHSGKLTYCAREFGVKYDTLKKRIDEDEDLIQLVSDLRNAHSETLLDMAEDTLQYAMRNRETDLGNALKSTFFVLNNKGKERGYSPANNPSVGTDQTSVREVAQHLASLSRQISRTADAGRSGLETK